MLNVIVIVGALCGMCTTVPGAGAGTSSPGVARAGGETPFACNAFALDPKARKRHFDELGPRLRELRKAAREIPDGYEFEFAPDPETYRLVSEWMGQERACCPFFDLALRIEREGGPMWLRLTGRPGVKAFIREEFPPAWFDAPRR